jgi:hypothetical protein
MPRQRGTAEQRVPRCGALVLDAHGTARQLDGVDLGTPGGGALGGLQAGRRRLHDRDPGTAGPRRWTILWTGAHRGLSNRPASRYRTEYVTGLQVLSVLEPGMAGSFTSHLRSRTRSRTPRWEAGRGRCAAWRSTRCERACRSRRRRALPCPVSRAASALPWWPNVRESGTSPERPRGAGGGCLQLCGSAASGGRGGSADRFGIVRGVVMQQPFAYDGRLRTRALRCRSAVYLRQNRRRPKSLDDEVDTK